VVCRELISKMQAEAASRAHELHHFATQLSHSQRQRDDFERQFKEAEKKNREIEKERMLDAVRRADPERKAETELLGQLKISMESAHDRMDRDETVRVGDLEICRSDMFECRASLHAAGLCALLWCLRTLPRMLISHEVNAFSSCTLHVCYSSLSFLEPSPSRETLFSFAGSA
jgi:hypothetical protein